MQDVLMPFVVVAELRAGFALGTRGRKNTDILDRFLAAPEVGILYPDETTLVLYGNLFASLRTRGTPIPTNDLWISACCIQHSIPLATSDDHFRVIDSLLLI